MVRLTAACLLLSGILCSGHFAYGYHRLDDIITNNSDTIGTLAWPTWPNGIVPYDFDPGFPQAERATLNVAIQDYTAKTCIKWVARTGQSAYVRFYKSSTGCASTGAGGGCYKNGETPVTIGTCTHVTAFIHEMGHVLCYGHEQDRADHDAYIYAGQPSCPGVGTGTISEHLYDYLSVMHYGCDDCLKPRLPGVEYCGGGILGPLDAEKINDMYQCGGCHSYRFRLPSQTSPGQAFGGGTDVNGAKTSPCRGYVEGSIVVGTASSNLVTCYLAYRGIEHGIRSGFEVLTNPSGANLLWVKAPGTSIPSNAHPAGRGSLNQPVYIGRCNLDVGGLKSVTIGWVVQDNPRELVLPFNGLEYRCTDFEILVCS